MSDQRVTLRNVRTGETVTVRMVEREGRRTVTEDDHGQRMVWSGRVCATHVEWRLEC